jgi:nucleoside-diphosphate kinase
MIKPDGVQQGLTDEIIKRLTDAGLNITHRKEVQPTRELALEHYADDDEWYRNTGSKTIASYKKQGHKITDVFEKEDPIVVAKVIRQWLAEYLTSGSVVAMIIEGPDGTIEKIREVAGGTEPASAEPGTIRGDLASDSYLSANGERRALYNLIHASESAQEAEREIKLWFPELK